MSLLLEEGEPATGFWTMSPWAPSPKKVDYDHLKALRLMFKTPPKKGHSSQTLSYFSLLEDPKNVSQHSFLPSILLASQPPFTVHGDIVKRSTMPQNFTRCDDSFEKWLNIISSVAGIVTLSWRCLSNFSSLWRGDKFPPKLVPCSDSVDEDLNCPQKYSWYWKVFISACSGYMTQGSSGLRVGGCFNKDAPIQIC